VKVERLHKGWIKPFSEHWFFAAILADHTEPYWVASDVRLPFGVTFLLQMSF